MSTTQQIGLGQHCTYLKNRMLPPNSASALKSLKLALFVSSASTRCSICITGHAKVRTLQAPAGKAADKGLLGAAATLASCGRGSESLNVIVLGGMVAYVQLRRETLRLQGASQVCNSVGKLGGVEQGQWCHLQEALGTLLVVSVLCSS